MYDTAKETGNSYILVRRTCKKGDFGRHGHWWENIIKWTFKKLFVMAPTLQILDNLENIVQKRSYSETEMLEEFEVNIICIMACLVNPHYPLHSLNHRCLSYQWPWETKEKVMDFWVVMPCSVLFRYQSSRGP